MLRPRDLAPLPPHRHAGAGLLTSNLASSLRKQGPITTGVDVLASDRSFSLFQQEMARRMGPRVRGDDVRARYGVPIPICFSAASIRCGGSILMTSACPVSSTLLRLDRIAGQPVRPPERMSSLIGRSC